MTDVFIGLGSNIGDGIGNLRRAWEKLGEAPEVELLKLSSPYYTRPLGMETPNWFSNAVGLIETSFSPDELLAALLAIEDGMGRDRAQEGEDPSDRIIDLDLLYYGGMLCDSPDFSLPHPEIEKRLFVLAPLAELAPDHCHPVSRRSSTEMMDLLLSGQNGQPEEQKVRRMSWPEGELTAE